MEALRIVLFQNSANYKKEETVDNKTTYPLPPLSTVIGALHNACNFKEYHPMDISIQGKYEAMIRKPYTDYCFLNSTQDDRGILVKMRNASMLSTAFDKVASAKKSQGNSFRQRITIQVINENLLKEYCYLKELNDKIKEFKDNRIKAVSALLKKRKKRLADKKSKLDKSSSQFKLVDQREKELKQMEKDINQRLKEYEEIYYKKPISQFKTLTTSLKYYEILTNVELIIHVSSDKETLEEIKEHIYDLKSIGRSEDFVEVREVSFVTLHEESKKEVESNYSSYIDYNLVKEDGVYYRMRNGIAANGTKYYLNKKYTIIDNKRKFEKKKVLYISKFSAEEACEGLYFDKVNEDKTYIVNLL